MKVAMTEKQIIATFNRFSKVLGCKQFTKEKATTEELIAMAKWVGFTQGVLSVYVKQNIIQKSKKSLLDKMRDFFWF